MTPLYFTHVRSFLFPLLSSHHEGRVLGQLYACSCALHSPFSFLPFSGKCRHKRRPTVKRPSRYKLAWTVPKMYTHTRQADGPRAKNFRGGKSLDIFCVLRTRTGFLATSSSKVVRPPYSPFSHETGPISALCVCLSCPRRRRPLHFNPT